MYTVQVLAGDVERRLGPSQVLPSKPHHTPLRLTIHVRSRYGHLTLAF